MPPERHPFETAFTKGLMLIGGFAAVAALAFVAVGSGEGMASGFYRALVLWLSAWGMAALLRKTHRMALVGHILATLILLLALSSAWQFGLQTTLISALIVASPFGTLTGGQRSGRFWLGASLAVFPVIVARTTWEDLGMQASLLITSVGATVASGWITLAFHRIALERAESLERSNQALRASEAQSKVASQAKSTFLATMSHEIRTPLNAVIGLSGLLCERPLPAEDREMAEQIQRSGSHLLGLLDDVLDLSRVESDRIQLEEAPFDLLALCRNVVSVLQPTAKTKGVTLRTALPAGEHLWVHGDAQRLRQVLVNLLSNALKFTHRGFVELRLRAVQSGQGLHLELEVQDSGVGIPAEAQSLIFEAFAQADQGRDRSYGGTGLGLAISARLIALMGGTLRLLDSQEGQGSTFQAKVLLPQAEAPAGIDEVTLLPAAMRVLVVEDEPINRKVVVAQLSHAGVQTAVATNGRQALELATDDIDLVLMDQQMPVMDGLAATRALRAQGFDRPIIALTASAFAEDREACLEAGMDAFLSKPIDRDALLRALAEWAPGQAARKAG